MQNVIFFYLSPSPLSLKDALELCFCSHDRHIIFMIHLHLGCNIPKPDSCFYRRTRLGNFEGVWGSFSLKSEILLPADHAVITVLCCLQGAITYVMVHIIPYIWISSLQELSFHHISVFKIYDV